MENPENRQTLPERWEYPDFSRVMDPVPAPIPEEEPQTAPPGPEPDTVLPPGAPETGIPDPQTAEALATLDAIGQAMHALLTGFDETLYSTLLGIIRKAILKVIHKELHADPVLLKGMIDEALARLGEAGEATILTVSPEDKALLDQPGIGCHYAIEVDPSLAKGDFVLKNRITTVVSVLEERIDALLGIGASAE